MVNKTKIAIHQPNFIPWPEYFAKIKAADIFVLLDSAEYSKNSFINRNKMLINNEIKWITIPVHYKGFSKKSINKIKISLSNFEPQVILKTLYQNYKNYPFFNLIFPEFQEFLIRASKEPSLSTLNKNLIFWVCNLLEIKTKILDSSSLGVQHQSATETLVAICQACKGDVYFSGIGGKKYLKEGLFEKAGVQLQYLNTEKEVKKWKGLSILHWLFLQGPSIEI